ncbi:ribonuclease kappa-B-like [Cydia splendana]|uniref:ribonuclease kappa-B-like n=1 Tax=Cydia splendana TaxID=1100963 RepID=UPI00300CE999
MLQFCGVCYMCLSIWGIIQLSIMGILYRVESLSLIEDTEAHEFEDTQDFIKHTKKNYKQVRMSQIHLIFNEFILIPNIGRPIIRHDMRTFPVSVNCFIASFIYVVILGLSLLCISKAKKNAKLKEAKLLDDTLSCTFEVVELTEKQKKKIT